jgi:uncharacterized protein (DUF58 family)
MCLGNKLTVSSQRLFDDRTRRKLEQLMLVAQRVRVGAIKGDRRSAKRGSSIEFVGYRNYVQGDDLRHLDWNLYARTEKPYIKQYEDEQDLAVHILIDQSESMNFPLHAEPTDHHKFTYAKRLAAGIATIALSTNDRLRLTAAHADQVERFGPARGRNFQVPLYQFLQRLKPHTTLDFNQFLSDYAKHERLPGLLFILSDLFHRDAYREGLQALIGRGYEVAVVQVLAPNELDPSLLGDLRLVDAENFVPQDVSLDQDMRQLYLRRVRQWQTELSRQFRQQGIHYVLARTDVSFERIILNDLRRLGLVR